jgi:alanine dehydrogenase
MTPNEVLKLTSEGFKVYIQTNAGINAYFTDSDYINSGAVICDTIEDIYKYANLIVKVKEPQEYEYDLINSSHTIFTFFHFASNHNLITAMQKSGATCIAYETIINSEGKFPILSEMSKIAGEQGLIEANKFRKINDLSNEVITIIGVGNVGLASLNKAKELGYKNINLVDKNFDKIEKYKKEGFNVYQFTNLNLITLLKISTIVIGSIYNNGQKAKKIICDDMLKLLPYDSIFIDVAIDQGGMTSQSKVTSITDPIIKYHNTNIYCVSNIPSLIPHQATIRLSNVIYPYVIDIANKKITDEINSGINIKDGLIFHRCLQLF